MVNGSGPSLLGCDWLRVIHLDLSYLTHIHAMRSSRCQEVVDRFPSVFKDELRLIKGTQARFKVDANTQPKFLCARPVPYALRSKVVAKLEGLEKSNTITPITFSKWATSIVPVLKQDGKVRICGEYKLTVNQVTKTDPYPVFRTDHLFASLSKGKSFSKLDLAQAYQQILLLKGAKELTTINKHKDWPQYNCLPFGVSFVPAIFQRTMDNLLQGYVTVSRRHFVLAVWSPGHIVAAGTLSHRRFEIWFRSMIDGRSNDEKCTITRNVRRGMYDEKCTTKNVR